MTVRQDIPTLSIVIPVHNEAQWVGSCVEHAATAIGNSGFAGRAEIVIVDDGSDQETKNVLSSLAPGPSLRVITQDNRGRFAAREAGIRAASGDLVFLLDSRVFVAPESLRFVASSLNGERLPAWNGHVEIDVEGNPFARFWRTVTYVAWRDYLGNPRTTSFGLEEYDRYPKGTGCFIASRALLVRALGEFSSMYEDSRFSSDDTLLIRSIAAEQPINISPQFACSYTSRDSLGRFLRHAFHRGTTFVDGFGRPGTRFFGALLAFFPSSLAFALLALRRPRIALALALGAPLAAAAGATAMRRPPGDVVAFALLSGPFALAYSAGIWRGGMMAIGHRAAR